MLQRYYLRPAKQYLLFISQSFSFNYPMETLGGHEIKLIEFINSENLLLFEMWFSILFSCCQWGYNEVYRNCKLCLGFLIRCLIANYTLGKVSCQLSRHLLKTLNGSFLCSNHCQVTKLNAIQVHSLYQCLITNLNFHLRRFPRGNAKTNGPLTFMFHDLRASSKTKNRLKKNKI